MQEAAGLQLPKIDNRKALVSLAIALEIRARQRFQAMIQATRSDGREDLACLFERLEYEEGLHVDQLLELAGPDGFDPELVEKDLEEILGDSDEIPAGFEFSAMTVYASLADAVRAEEKAFAYYSFLVSATEDSEIKALAEELAKEELDHAALLRRARRAAFRAPDRAEEHWPDPKKIHSQTDFWQATREAEAGYLERHGGALLTLGILEQLGSQMRQRLPDFALPVAADQEPSGGAEAIRAAVDEAQVAFEFYDAMATGTQDQDVMIQAQDMTELALARIKAISLALSRSQSQKS